MRETMQRWWAVALFAAAMAWVEASAVFYLRTLVNRIVPYQPNPLPPMVGADWAELVREMATLVMLAAVGWLAGRSWRSRLGYFGVAFGLWDILYYVFLKLLTGWPRSLLDWDVLFLLPLPWWGPVLAPMLMAAVLVVGGTLVVRGDQPERPLWPGRGAMACGIVGALLGLYAFMADAWRAAPQGEEALRAVLPTRFNWPLFLLALALMIVPVVDLWRRQSAEPVNGAESAPPAPAREGTQALEV